MPSILDELGDAKRVARTIDSARKNAVLTSLSESLLSSTQEVMRANERDLAEFRGASAMRDRLVLNEERIAAMAKSLQEVAASPDPVGKVVEERTLENGLILRRVTAPLGAIFMIFESRPNVATEAFSLAFKSGNAILLRGGSEAKHSLAVLYHLIRNVLMVGGLPSGCCSTLEDYDRELVRQLLGRKDVIDVVVPRGGEGLINFVVENSSIPVIKHDKGLCHTYVHSDADLEMALAITLNAKTSRPSVCNAMETLLVDREVASEFIPRAYNSMKSFGVRWHASNEVALLLGGSIEVTVADEAAWNTEYLDFDLNCRIVDGLDEAIDHIDAHGSGHSEAIITRNELLAREFQSRVDAAAVYWNASTRFTDGGCFGLGAELGISTQKLHARGPVGLEALVTPRWVIDGNGQVR